jgi:hypothetical protein
MKLFIIEIIFFIGIVTFLIGFGISLKKSSEVSRTIAINGIGLMVTAMGLKVLGGQ